MFLTLRLRYNVDAAMQFKDTLVRAPPYVSEFSRLATALFLSRTFGSVSPFGAIRSLPLPLT
jgi:hypothetical protein